MKRITTNYKGIRQSGSTAAKLMRIKRMILVMSFAFMAISMITAQNPIVTENALPGNPISEWYITGGTGDGTISGFSTDMSVNKGNTVYFKITTNPVTNYNIKIYRMGYYQGDGARMVADLGTFSGIIQPSGSYDNVTGLTDCGNWSQSASWAVPSDAVSGVYFALLTRLDNNGKNNIIFVVRDDARNAPVLFKTSDATWLAYNLYGGHSFYFGPTTQFSHAVKGSYNRPFTNGGQDWILNAEYPMIRFLERNGYDMSYTTDVDMDRDPTPITPSKHKVILSVGHDEYWSAGEREKFEAARDAGVHLAFFSGNEIYWKTRWEDDHRTLVCYKEGTMGEYNCGTKCDPSPLWTGLWRDGCTPPYDPNDGCRPESELSGQISWVDGSGSIQVPYAYKDYRIWRHTSVASLAPGQSVTFPYGTLGSEWDKEQPQYPYPPRRMKLSETSLSGFKHHLSLYRHPSGSLVFGAGTIQWSWGLDSIHDRGNNPPHIDMQQATVNILADMEVAPGTLMAQLVDPFLLPSDLTPPSSVITYPIHEDVLPGMAMIITGTASDAGGGIVAGVEISFNGGSTWYTATGTTNWSYAYQPTSPGTTNIRTRAWDDSGNLETVGSVGSDNNINIVITNPINYSVFPPTYPLTSPVANSGSSVEVGMKFKSNVDGFITGFRYYKMPGFTGNHIGNLWSISGTNLASATFTNETSSGWQSVTLPTPVAITANTIYVVSYFCPTGEFAVTNPFFSSDFINGALTGLGWTTSERNGVYVYSATSTFPYLNFQTSNYWADVLFTTSVNPDNTPPTVNSVSPSSGAVNVSLTFQPSGTFSEALDPASVNSSTCFITDPLNNPVTCSLNISGNTIIFTPTVPFDYSTAYTVTFKGGIFEPHITDLAGNPLENDYSWSFTTVNPSLPVITVHPESQIICTGDEVTFVSTAFATPTPTIQWQISENGGETWDDIQNETSLSYSFFVTNDDNNKLYRAVWTNILGSVNSDSALLTVVPEITGIISAVNQSLCPDFNYQLQLTSATGYPPYIIEVNGRTYTNVTIGQTFASIPIRETIWSAVTVPSVPATTDPQSIEVGVKFTSNVNGYIHGIRFYKGTGNTGVHTGSLWNLAGTQLATATFINETATGWQEVLFETPVAITAGTIYVASYFAPEGRYARNDNYFAGGPYSNGNSLEAIAHTSGQPNGVYVYTPTGGFPNLNFGSPNYWVDVVFSYSADDTFISNLTMITDSNGCFTEGDPVSTTSATVVPAPSGIITSAGPACTGSDMNLVFTSTTGTGPFSLLINGLNYEEVQSGIPFDVGTTGVIPPSINIFGNLTGSAYTDILATEVGVKFQSSESGQITGIRFYKTSSANGGTHTGSLWTGSGTLLATATFTNETSSGWQEVLFDTPVQIQPNVTYVASYFAPEGHYARSLNYFTNSGYSNGPLTALQADVSGPNGVYINSSGGVFPNLSFQNANYWVDVIYNSGISNYFALTNIEDANGCSINANPVDTALVILNALPVITIDPVSPMCISAESIELNAQPEGGTFSGSGVSGNLFDPQESGAGTFKITYIYTDGNSCSNSDSIFITVYEYPEVTLDSIPPLCLSAEPVELTGLPEGGSFFGTGVTGNLFDPQESGAGTFKITYIYTDGNSCSNSDSIFITVYEYPAVNLDSVPPTCIFADPVELTGLPEGGTFFGTGVSGNLFDPQESGTGTFKITYLYTDGNSCSNSDSIFITVYEYPEVTLDSISPLCLTAEPVELTGLPEGGTFFGTGVSGNMFDPQESGSGTFKITYTYSDGNGCSNSDSIFIVVHDLPLVSIDPVSPLMVTDPPVLLNGSPSGGVFTGSGVNEGYFNPAITGAGTFMITYTYSDENGCSNSDSTEIIVNDNNTIKTLNLKVYLEGAFNETEMTTLLNTGGLVPNSQPYSGVPWNYNGTEMFTSVPNINVVDWVIVELRDATDAVSATPETRKAQYAALLLKNGSIVDTGGSSLLQITETINEQLFVVIIHRNHLAVMSSSPLVLSEGIYSYDFTDAENKAYGGSDGHKEIFPGIWGMAGGDANADGIINATDKDINWEQQAGNSGYLSADFNLNTQVENTDKNDILLPNTGKQTQVPQ